MPATPRSPSSRPPVRRSARSSAEWLEPWWHCRQPLLYDSPSQGGIPPSSKTAPPPASSTSALGCVPAHPAHTSLLRSARSRRLEVQEQLASLPASYPRIPTLRQRPRACPAWLAVGRSERKIRPAKQPFQRTPSASAYPIVAAPNSHRAHYSAPQPEHLLPFSRAAPPRSSPPILHLASSRHPRAAGTLRSSPHVSPQLQKQRAQAPHPQTPSAFPG